MIAKAESMQKLKFKAFLSHAYDAAELNIEFFKVFDHIAGVQFEVDIGEGNLNVTRLERRIRDCDAFVGIYPFPGERTVEPSFEEALKASKYFRLEMELAARAGRPSIVYYDRRYQSAIQPLKGFSQKTFGAHDVNGTMTTRLQSEIESAFRGFCDRLKAEIQGRATGFQANRSRCEVGLLVPRGRGGYPREAIHAVKEVASRHGYSESELVDLGWPPVADARLFDQLDSLDWIFADVGPQTAATGMLGLIHSRFVPAVRMHRGIPPEPAEWLSTRYVGRLYGALDVGYLKDIVYWQDDVHLLNTELRSRVEVVLRPPSENEVIKTLNEALDYFRRAAVKKTRVFVSYAGADRLVAQRLVAVMRGHLRTVFDYLDRGESLPPGSPWREEIKRQILAAQFGILLISPAYNSSGYCKWEKDLLVDAHQGRGLELFPVLLKGRARDVPIGLEFLQVARLNKGDTPEDVALGIVREIQKKPEGKSA